MRKSINEASLFRDGDGYHFATIEQTGRDDGEYDILVTLHHDGGGKDVIAMTLEEALILAEGLAEWVDTH